MSCDLNLQNVLKESKSPYLRQHKDNPVHWQEWNDETIKLARKADRPIFLSSGYSACHWCHVFAHESFENEEIAGLMNDHFINIKLDREERPDIDRIYMTYLQSLKGGGGWPLSVFLTPNLEPFFAGTYFPRHQFKTLLVRVRELWKDDRSRCEQMGKEVVESLRELNTPAKPASLEDIMQSNPAGKLWAHYIRTHDPVNGGFSPRGPHSRGPKFPSCALTLDPLSRFAAYTPPKGQLEVREEARRMGIEMIRSMWEGGIHDFGGGFARYSIDEKWRIPHFEKMLYDQAQLMSAAVIFAGICVPEISRGASADDLERDRKLCETFALDILRYVVRDLSSPEGAFYGAEDADSSLSPGAKKTEGAFYVWTKEEFDEVVGEDKDLVGYLMGVEKDGNVPARHDSHGELTGKNILYQAHSVREAAVHFGYKADEECLIQTKVDAALEKLHVRREKTRERPSLDDKIICAWNGLMISALCRFALLSDPDEFPILQKAITMAEKTARFVMTEMWDKETRMLYRSYRDGRGAIAQTDDYACLIKELLDLYEVGGKEEFAMFARELQIRQDELFWDEKDGGYFVSAADDSLLVRLKDGSDGAEPSAASNSIHNLLRLALLFSDESDRWEARAYDMLKSLSGEITKHPMSIAYTVTAMMDIEKGSSVFYLTGSKDDPFVKTTRRKLGSTFNAHTITIMVDPDNLPHALGEKNVTVREIISNGGAEKPGLMVCREGECGLPMRDLDQVEKYLAQIPGETVG